MKTTGLHHVTAIASDAQQNHDFYTEVLGLRLVKTTVNFDDPSSYHTYFGDYRGSPGTIVTFFPWPGAHAGRVGAGYTSATAYTIPRGTWMFWENRLAQHRVRGIETFTRFDESGVRFEDPDGMVLELIERDSPLSPHPVPDVPAEHGIRGFHSVTLLERKIDGTRATLIEQLGYRAERVEADRHRFVADSDKHGRVVDVIVDPSAGRGTLGAGSVHHVAFRATDDAQQSAALAALQGRGFNVSPVMDRNYFHSIYFREPGGVLFEIATDGPGMHVDEPVESLGQSLKLPAVYENRRAQIEHSLPILERR